MLPSSYKLKSAVQLRAPVSVFSPGIYLLWEGPTSADIAVTGHNGFDTPVVLMGQAASRGYGFVKNGARITDTSPKTSAGPDGRATLVFKTGEIVTDPRIHEKISEAPQPEEKVNDERSKEDASKRSETATAEASPLADAVPQPPPAGEGSGSSSDRPDLGGGDRGDGGSGGLPGTP